MTRHTRHRLWILAVLVSGLGCVANVEEAPCNDSSQCPVGQRCDSQGTQSAPNQPVCRTQLRGEEIPAGSDGGGTGGGNGTGGGGDATGGGGGDATGGGGGSATGGGGGSGGAGGGSAATETNCTDGLDNDGDLLTDCADPDCAGQTCRAAQGACDVAEVCTGGACPADGVAAPGVVCRPATDGGCDIAEVCDGGSTACPPDAFAPNTRACRNATSVCDVTEMCPGNGPDCPSNGFTLVGTPCGATCQQICDGQGMCSGAGGSCPNGFACGSGACLTSCSSGAQCQTNFNCVGNQCVRVPESNCLDGIDNNGDGLADCQDPTCVGSQVQCVPAVGAGADVGILLNSGPCPAGYSQLLNRYQGLTGQPCLGCTCTTGCTVTVTAYANADCTGGQVSSFFSSTGTSYLCNSVSSGTRQSGIKSAFGKTCTPGGAATQAAPTWSTSQVFCVAQSSQTCAAGNVCVPLPSSGKTCSDVDSASSCPSGYSGTTSNFFTSYTNGSCGACSACASGASFTCGSFSTAGTAGCAAADLIGTTCSSIGPSRNPVAGLANQFTRSGTDNCTINPTNTPPQPTGGRKVCCLP